MTASRELSNFAEVIMGLLIAVIGSVALVAIIVFALQAITKSKGDGEEGPRWLLWCGIFVLIAGGGHGFGLLYFNVQETGFHFEYLIVILIMSLPGTCLLLSWWSSKRSRHLLANSLKYVGLTCLTVIVATFAWTLLSTGFVIFTLIVLIAYAVRVLDPWVRG